MIGLTGAYCAGKNYIGELLAKRGYELLDIDKLGHIALEGLKTTLAQRWPTVIRSDGGLDRKALGEIVFKRPDQLSVLEALVHPEVDKLIGRWIAERDKTKIVLNAALLHRSLYYTQLDFVIVVSAPTALRFFRALKRDKASPLSLIRRFSRQKGFNAQYSKNKADIVKVVNRSDCCPFRAYAKARLERRLDSILARKGMVR